LGFGVTDAATSDAFARMLASYLDPSLRKFCVYYI